MTQRKDTLLVIIMNLQFCHKFFLEEDFESLSDCQFDLFEDSLEKTLALIEGEKLMASDSEVLRGLGICSELLEQFWEQSVTTDFRERLEEVKEAFG